MLDLCQEPAAGVVPIPMGLTWSGGRERRTTRTNAARRVMRFLEGKYVKTDRVAVQSA